MLDVNKVSIAWNDENAELIIALVKALGYTVWYLTDPHRKTDGWAYFGGSSGEFCRSKAKKELHFTTIEAFLKAHFGLDKSPAQIELEEIQTQIKELSDKAASLQLKLSKGE